MGLRERLTRGSLGVTFEIPPHWELDREGDDMVNLADRETGTGWYLFFFPGLQMDLDEDGEASLKRDVEVHANALFEAMRRRGEPAPRSPRSPLVSCEAVTIEGGRALSVIHRMAYQPGSESRNLKSVRSSVPDDAFGQVTLKGPRSFDVTLRGDHEINTIMSGMPLWLTFETSSGTIRKYEAAVHLGAKLFALAGVTSIRPAADVVPVAAGTPADDLRYRLRVDTTKTYESIRAAGATTVRRSTRVFDLDWDYAGFAPLLEREGLALDASPTETRTAGIQIRVAKLGLTTKTAESVWPNECKPSVRSCISRANGAGDLGACGTYREVSTCRNEEPAPDPSVTGAANKVAADILAKTGQRYTPSIGELRNEGGKTIALVHLPRGGAAEWTIAPTVAFSKFVFRPEFKDTWQVQRFEKQLRNQHRMTGATIVAHGSPQGMAPRWQFVVDRAGARSTVVVEATSESTSNIVPFAYDDRAFREMAGHLIVDRALQIAAPAGPYAELEVYLRTNVLLGGGSGSGLEAVAPGDSPVGFDPANEVQLVAPSVWGDNAVYVTIVKATGAVRVADFN